MGGEIFLGLVYGFKHDLIYELPEELDFGLYTTSNVDHEVVYGIDYFSLSDNSTARHISSIAEECESDTKNSRKLAMDRFAHYFGKSAEWIVVMVGEMDLYCRTYEYEECEDCEECEECEELNKSMCEFVRKYEKNGKKYCGKYCYDNAELRELFKEMTDILHNTGE